MEINPHFSKTLIECLPVGIYLQTGISILAPGFWISIHPAAIL